MTPPVKGPRRYDNTARQARTRRTRASVIDAARALFLERGYAATTIEAISEASETPVATVYRLFSSKLGILTDLVDVSAVGDDEPVALGDRPHVRAILAERDPRRLLGGFAELARDVMSRLSPVHQILLSAAGSDPEAAALLAEHVRQRQEGQNRVAHALAQNQALHPTLNERDAADVIHALASPEVYRLLVTDREWTPQRYQEWLATTLIQQLLPEPARASRAAGDRRTRRPPMSSDRD